MMNIEARRPCACEYAPWALTAALAVRQAFTSVWCAMLHKRTIKDQSHRTHTACFLAMPNLSYLG